MNEILKKRIEEEASDIVGLCPDCNFHCNGPYPCIPKIIYEKLIEIADFALQNQWVSVKEALPQKDDLYFVLINSTHPRVTEFENGKWQGYDNITHWMEIPKNE